MCYSQRINIEKERPLGNKNVSQKIVQYKDWEIRMTKYTRKQDQKTDGKQERNKKIKINIEVPISN